ncbi:MAG: peptidoglycan-binding protein [Symploca sp. SIO2C1]|nr:peptidoglycan-binding protein [Symploca sp. SIO2C1]
METLAYLQLATLDQYLLDLNLESSTNDPRSLFKLNSRGTISAGMLFVFLNLATILSLSNSAMALQRGDQGTEVVALQEGMKAAGAYDGPITGYYGELTKAAVIQFQQAQGLTSDGIAGVKTLATLQKLQTSSDTATSLQIDTSSPNLLKRGSTGKSVTHLQHALRALGFYYGPITGYYGSSTEASVIQFQQAQGLQVDGIVGAKTIVAMNAE